MTHLEFELLVSAARKRQDAILKAKGNDYAPGEDRLSNFKAISELLGVTPSAVCAIYMFKHILAIMKLVESGQPGSEPATSRFVDAVNYLYLLEATLREREPYLFEDVEG